MTNVFIAPKIKVGFRSRTDCFTGKLAYIIYYDAKGKLHKEKSWEGWRDKKLPIEEFENTPMDGFTLNKDVKRYSGDWFSSHRTLIRVHDPRGFEFEVTTENLIGILMHTDCLRRGLIGQFVYAWVGPELVLLPINSEEYQSAVKFTTGLSKKVKAKDLVPGISYKTKREGDVVFIGKLNWYAYGYAEKSRYTHAGLRLENKSLVFTSDDGKTFFKKPSVDFLSEANSDTPVSNFAELVQKFNENSYANKIIKYEFRPAEFDPEVKAEYYWAELRRNTYFIESNVPGLFCDSTVTVRADRKPNYSDGRSSNEYTIRGYEFSKDYGHERTAVKQSDGEIVEIAPTTPRDNYSYYNSGRDTHDLEYMKSQKLYDCYVVFENGKEKRVKSLNELQRETI